MEKNRRRRFGRAAAAAVSGFSLLSVALTPAVQARVAHATPKYGGSITVRQLNNPDCLDPQKTAQGASYQVFSLVVDSLLDMNAKGRLVGNLATSWKVAKGGTVITFKLRHGVRFSNGDPFTAAAVKYTFDRAVDPATKSPATGGDLAAVKQTRVINPYTVQLILKTPSRPLFTNLTIPYTGILDPKATKAEGSNTCQDPIGTGNYKIKSVQPGFANEVLVRNPYRNWQPSWYTHQGKPYINQITLIPVTDDATAVSEMLAHQIDVGGVPGTQLSRIKGNKNFRLVYTKSQGEAYLGFNMGNAPFNNPAVRKAVIQAISRPDVIKVAYNGLAIPAYSPVPSTLPYYDKKAQTLSPAYSPSAAGQVISANHATGPYTLLVPQASVYPAIAELVQGELANVGMKINIDLLPLSQYIPAAAKGSFDLNLIGWGWPDPDFLYNLFDSSQGHGAGLNWTNDNNPQLDSLLEKSRTTLNPKKAQAVWNQIQQLMISQSIIMPLAISKSPTAFNSRIQNIHLNKSGALAWADLWVTK